MVMAERFSYCNAIEAVWREGGRDIVNADESNCASETDILDCLGHGSGRTSQWLSKVCGILSLVVDAWGSSCRRLGPQFRGYPTKPAPFRARARLCEIRQNTLSQTRQRELHKMSGKLQR